MTALEVVAVSHPGRVRIANQDQLVVSTMIGNGNFVKLSRFTFASPEVVAVIDGMGGHAGGEVAARIAAATVASCWQPPAGEADLARLIEAANEAIYVEAECRPDLAEMGATVVACVPGDGGWIVGHVGDARAYAASSGFAVLLTEDDRRLNGRLTQALGGLPRRTEVTVHTAFLPFGTHERILLCSDGLSEVVSFPDLQDALGAADGTTAVRQLLESCLAAGAPDNVTLALLSRPAHTR